MYVKIEAAGGKPGGTLRVGRLRLTCRTARSPYACGDATVSQWGPKTDLGVYGGCTAGFLAALVGRTDQEHVLALDLLATDFFRDRAYPTLLCFNPDKAARTVRIPVGDQPADLYETTTGTFVRKGVRGEAKVTIPADSAHVVVIAPAGGTVTRDGRKLRVSGVVVDYRAGEP